MKPQTASKLASLVYTPQFFKAEKADQNYQPDIDGAMREGIAFGRDNKLRSAQQLIKDKVGHAAMLTDLQRDFCDDGRLPVTGTNQVVLRTCIRLVNGTVKDHYAGVTYSLDGHPLNHISFGTYYRNEKGEPLDLSQRKAACLTLEDRAKCIFRAYGFQPDGSTVNLGYYQPRFDPKDAVAYWDHLQKTGQGDIWGFVPHCVLGTDGTNLHPLLVETIAFMVGARSFQPTILGKGHLSDTDWFGPLCPCRPNPNHPQGGFQKAVVDEFKRFQTTEFSGVAEDFCDFNMKRQTIEYLDGTEYLGKLRFVTDCTAPIIPNAKHVTKLNAEAQQKGVKFITHDTPFSAA